jgi:hypothetical protein
MDAIKNFLSKLTFKEYINAGLLVSALIWGAWGWLSKQSGDYTSLERRIANLEVYPARIDSHERMLTITAINVASIDKHLDALDKKYETLDNKLTMLMMRTPHATVGPTPRYNPTGGQDGPYVAANMTMEFPLNSLWSQYHVVTPDCGN